MDSSEGRHELGSNVFVVQPFEMGSIWRHARVNRCRCGCGMLACCCFCLFAYIFRLFPSQILLLLLLLRAVPAARLRRPNLAAGFPGAESAGRWLAHTPGRQFCSPAKIGAAAGRRAPFARCPLHTHKDNGRAGMGGRAQRVVRRRRGSAPLRGDVQHPGLHGVHGTPRKRSWGATCHPRSCERGEPCSSLSAMASMIALVSRVWAATRSCCVCGGT